MSLQFFFFLSGLAIQLSDTAAAEMLLRFFEVCNPLALASHVAGCITGMHHRQSLNLLLPLPLGCVRRGGCIWVQRPSTCSIPLHISLKHGRCLSELKGGMAASKTVIFLILSSQMPRFTGTRAVTQHKYWASKFQSSSLSTNCSSLQSHLPAPTPWTF